MYVRTLALASGALTEGRETWQAIVSAANVAAAVSDADLSSPRLAPPPTEK